MSSLRTVFAFIGTTPAAGKADAKVGDQGKPTPGMVDKAKKIVDKAKEWTEDDPQDLLVLASPSPQHYFSLATTHFRLPNVFFRDITSLYSAVVRQCVWRADMGDFGRFWKKSTTLQSRLNRFKKDPQVVFGLPVKITRAWLKEACFAHALSP